MPNGYVLYDGACGFCSWWIPFWKKTINKTGYDIAPLQADWVRDKLFVSAKSPLHDNPGQGDSAGTMDELLNRDIVLLFNDGKQLIGADAYIFGMKKIWWSSPVGYLLGLPGFRQLTWVFYKIFNRNRFLVSKICRLEPEINIHYII